MQRGKKRKREKKDIIILVSQCKSIITSLSLKVQELPLSLVFVCRLKFVIDHAAKPEIKDGKIDEWKKGMEMLAQSPNVFCKM